MIPPIEIPGVARAEAFDHRRMSVELIDWLVHSAPTSSQRETGITLTFPHPSASGLREGSGQPIDSDVNNLPSK